jgi:hypothetical protein
MNDLDIQTTLTEDNTLQESQIKAIRGRMIVVAIAALITVGAISSVAAGFHVWTFVISVVNVCLAVLLIFGIKRVRYFFIVTMGIGAVATFFSLGSMPMETANLEGTPVIASFHLDVSRAAATLITPAEGFELMYWVLSALLACYILCVFVLIFSKNVKVFLSYANRHNRQRGY